MKGKPTLQTLLLLALPLLLMQSCRKDDPVVPFADNKYLVSCDIELVRTKENIINVLTIAATKY